MIGKFKKIKCRDLILTYSLKDEILQIQNWKNRCLTSAVTFSNNSASKDFTTFLELIVKLIEGFPKFTPKMNKKLLRKFLLEVKGTEPPIQKRR